MKLEQQCCSLELAKRLRELGVKQKSLFWWSDHTSPATLWREDALMEATADILISDIMFSAFTVAELGELLPTIKENWQTARYLNGTWFLTNHQNTLKVSEASTEADARAKMLIYLLENKLITLQ